MFNVQYRENTVIILKDRFICTRINIPYPLLFATLTQVSTNGVISFGQSFIYHTPTEFPSDTPEIYTSYVLAPFWADADLRILGRAFYEVHTNRTERERSQLEYVSGFITRQMNEVFNGTWMLVAFWDEVHPYGGLFPGPAVSVGLLISYGSHVTR